MDLEMKSTHKPWSRLDKFAAVFIMPAAFVLTVLWFSFPSDRFVKHISLNYDEGSQVFTFVREINPMLMIFGDEGLRGHHGRHRSTINLTTTSGLECSSPWYEAFYQNKSSNTVSYQTAGWAKPCLDAGPPFYVSTYMQIYLPGGIPLRTSRSDSQILPLGLEPTAIESEGD